MFRQLQQSALPNIPVLRGLIAWFNAVSDWLDDADTAPLVYASGKVLGSGTFDNEGAQRGGFLELIGHSTPGIYTLTLVTPVVDPDLYVVQATLTYFGATVDRVESISADLNGSDTIRVQVRAVTDVAGTPTFAMVNHDFYVSVTRLQPALVVVAPPTY